MANSRLPSPAPARKRPWYHPVELAKGLAIYAAVAYVIICVFLASMQTRMIYAVCGDPALPVHGVTLLTAWDNIANVGLSIYPWLPIRLLMIDKYDSIANLQHFPHPICVMRSEKDDLILPRLSLNLFAHLPDPKKMILFPNVGHNDWPDDPSLPWWDDALDFIAPK